MASKSKEVVAKEELSKMDIIRGLIRKQECAEDRVLCTNWLSFLSCSSKDEAKARDCLLDQMMRQLRKGKLSPPFTTHVHCRTDLHLLLDEEGRQRLGRLGSSEPQIMEAPQKPNRERRTSPFFWRQRVRHLASLEEKYRREEQERWLHELMVDTAMKEAGVQVELPVPVPAPQGEGNGSILDRARQRQEIKERRGRERLRTLDQGLQNVTERRQSDLQRRAEVRQLREQHLYEQQLKVKERHDHERKLMVKRREAHSPRSLSRAKDGTKEPSPQVEAEINRFIGEPAKEPEPGQEARKQVKCKTCHSVTSDSREQQAILRAENIKKKVLAYEELKLYHSKQALVERERLKMKQMKSDREKAEQEAEQGRAIGGRDAFDGRKKQVEGRKITPSEERDQKERDQKEREDTLEESGPRSRKYPHKEFRKPHENERKQKRKPEELENKEEPQKERKERQEEKSQGNSPRKLEKERELKARDIDEIRYNYFNLREKQLMQKWIDLRERYEVPPGELSPAQENERKRKERREKIKFLREATEHTELISKEVLEKTKSRTNFLPVELGDGLLKEREEEPGEMSVMEELPPGDRKSEQSNSKITLRQAHENFLAKAEEIYLKREPLKVQSCSKKNDLLIEQISNHYQEHLAKEGVVFSQNMDLFTDCWQRSQKNGKQADVIRGKCMQELQDTEAALQRISPRGEDSRTAALEDDKRDSGGNSARFQNDQANSNYQYPSHSDTDANGEESPQWDTYRSYRPVNEPFKARWSYPVKVLYKRELWRASSSTNVEEEPRQYRDDILVSYCTETGRKRYPHIRRTATRTIRGKREPLHRRTFRQLLKESGSNERSPSILISHNRILQRRLSVAKKIALNKFIRKTLMLEAGRLIHLLLYEKAQAQRSTTPPRHTFQFLVDSLLQNAEDVSPNVLEAIKHVDGQLEAQLGRMLEKQHAQQYKHDYEQVRDLFLRQNLVSDLLNDCCDQDPQLNKILRQIDQVYKRWKDLRLGLN